MRIPIFDSADTKRKYNRMLFKKVAPRYRFVTRALSFGRDTYWKKKLVKLLPVKDKPCIIDLASGTGDLAFYCAEKYPDSLIVGVDLSPDMICHAPVTLPESIEFSIQDMSNTGMRDCCADIITGGYALRNAPDLNITISEIHRLLKPGGYAAFLDFSKPKNSMGRVINQALLHLWGNFWGLVLHAQPSVYGYIAKSLAVFPDTETLKKMFESHGLVVVTHSTLFAGFSQIIAVQKPL